MKKFVLLLIFLLHSHFASSQKTHVTIFTGAANYNGELQPKRYTFQHAHLALGIGLDYELTDQLYIKTGIKFSRLSGQDSGTYNYKRNLSFTTNLSELQVGLEYDFINLQERDLTPYIFAGIALYHFDPYTKNIIGDKVYLQPLGTEGQGFFKGRQKYALTQFSIPFGAGLKFSLTDNLRIGLEVGLRKTFTDYIDDVSTNYVDKNTLLNNNGAQAVAFAFRGDEIRNRLPYPAEGKKRGNPDGNDWYYFSGVSFSFRIGTHLGYRYLPRFN